MADDKPIAETSSVLTGRHKFPLPIEMRREGIANYLKVTCLQSARLRGTEPHEELKSILFYGGREGDYLVMAHVPGDMRVDEKALAREVGPVRLMPLNDLSEKWQLQKGRVNPFTAEWYLGDRVIHVVCHSVFQNEFVHSNNDNVGGWITFRPQDIIHWVANVRVSRISKPRKNGP